MKHQIKMVEWWKASEREVITLNAEDWVAQGRDAIKQYTASAIHPIEALKYNVHARLSSATSMHHTVILVASSKTPAQR